LLIKQPPLIDASLQKLYRNTPIQMRVHAEYYRRHAPTLNTSFDLITICD